jgi:hypothetical protein
LHVKSCDDARRHATGNERRGAHEEQRVERVARLQRVEKQQPLLQQQYAEKLAELATACAASALHYTCLCARAVD